MSSFDMDAGGGLPSNPVTGDAAVQRPGSLIDRLPAVTAGAVPRTRPVENLVIAAIVISGLYFGHALLMPLALAVLLGFVLDPAITFIRRRGVPRVLAVVAVLLVAMILLGASAVLVAGQLRALSKDLPTYQANIVEKVHGLTTTIRQPGVFDEFTRVFGNVGKELSSAQTGAGQGDRQGRPAPEVDIVRRPATLAEPWGAWINWVAGPATTLGVIVVFLVLVLLDRGELRDRLLRLLGGNLHRNTDALNEVGLRVSKYLTMQLIVNATYGVPIALGLALIGVPGAIVWGLLAGLLRFVPYLGPLLAAVFPLTLALAVDPGWSMFLWTAALLIVIEVVVNNVLEPLVYGPTTGLAAISLIVAATFWTAIWGPVGLVLSTPLTVCLLVLGRHLPQLAFLEVLLGSEPALDAPTKVYQRLLAGDDEEAAELATETARKESLQAFYNDIGVPALRLASAAHNTVATAEHRHRVVAGMARVIDDLRDEFPDSRNDAPEIACIGGRWEVDALAAEMAAHSLGAAGHAARRLPTGIVSSDFVSRLDLDGVRVVCLSYFSPEPRAHVRYFSRRLKKRWPEVRLVAALWNAPALADDPQARADLQVDAIVVSIDELHQQIDSMRESVAATGYEPAPVADGDAQRVAALDASGIADPEARSTLDAVAKRAAEVFDVPMAEVSLVDAQWRIAQGSADAAPQAGRADPRRRVPRAMSLCGHVVAGQSTMVVPDLLRDPRFAANPLAQQRGIRFYAGAPLKDGNGIVLGTLCLLDAKPRALSEREIELLETMAGDVLGEVRTRLQQAAAMPAPADAGGGNGGAGAAAVGS